MAQFINYSNSELKEEKIKIKEEEEYNPKYNLGNEKSQSANIAGIKE